MKVIATDASVKLNKGLKEFHRLVEEGEIFEVDEERFKFLNGDNPYNAVFVEEYNKGKITFLNTEEKKAPAKKSPAKKSAAKKPTANKTTGKKPATKKTTAKKTVTKKGENK